MARPQSYSVVLHQLHDTVCSPQIYNWAANHAPYIGGSVGAHTIARQQQLLLVYDTLDVSKIMHMCFPGSCACAFQ
jgi:hypothetical protein